MGRCQVKTGGSVNDTTPVHIVLLGGHPLCTTQLGWNYVNTMHLTTNKNGAESRLYRYKANGKMASTGKSFANEGEEHFDETRQLVQGKNTPDKNRKADSVARDYLKDTQVKISVFTVFLIIYFIARNWVNLLVSGVLDAFNLLLYGSRRCIEILVIL